jgi:hypothetical protein
MFAKDLTVKLCFSSITDIPGGAHKRKLQSSPTVFPEYTTL